MPFKGRRKKHLQKRKSRNQARYSWSDFFADIFFYVPELIVLPFRLLWWGIRGLVRLFDWT
ncbi:hypothetical protein D0466_05630 [Peribacillus glennii]|uniref:Uncharacterized protein n=1 Tax=Peribacillus glennii TaxID=2303991 RepID=A0A372LGD9_9BACI|nr:hypothetical protein D0466_05630 [Peribacillus glennii]